MNRNAVFISVAIFALGCSHVGSQFLSKGKPQFRIRNFDDLISVGIESLFPEEVLSDDQMRATIKFRLYPDLKNASNYQVINLAEIGKDSTYLLKANAPTKIFVHGYLAHCDKWLFPKSLIQAYFTQMEEDKSEMNLICLDWGELANPSAIPNPLLYGEVVKNIPMVGEKLAELLATLYQTEIVRDFADVHILGLSLGAHAAGTAGHLLKSNWGINSKIGRITGMDPAGLLFRGDKKPNSEKLDAEDAEFVEVIHTNMGQLGLEGQIGHADFYPNGGKFQHRCYEAHPLAMIAEQVSGKCSHLISATYYRESLSHGKNITACKADSWDHFKSLTRSTGCTERVSFGAECPSTARGQYYLMM
ncbi:unnamed protein product [Orchesella dallaii]|uniref:Lipase domain-containing protein n=1 Tax=Orchesella dallaii TaxID=48710 RepID=A0ABP1Q4Z3_9HEXA